MNVYPLGMQESTMSRMTNASQPYQVVPLSFPGRVGRLPGGAGDDDEGGHREGQDTEQRCPGRPGECPHPGQSHPPFSATNIPAHLRPDQYLLRRLSLLRDTRRRGHPPREQCRRPGLLPIETHCQMDGKGSLGVYQADSSGRVGVPR